MLLDRADSHLHADFPVQRVVDEHNEENPGVYYAKCLKDQIPGTAAEVRLMRFWAVTSSGGNALFDRESYTEVHDNDIEIFDAFWCNCSLKDEIIAFHYDSKQKRMNFVGQHGLVRRISAVEAIAPGQTGMARLRDGQFDSESPEFEVKNTSSSALNIDDVAWACFIPNIKQDAFDDTGTTNPPPNPVSVKKGEWQTIAVGDGLFRVRLQKVDGNDGDAENQNTYKYDVYTTDGLTLIEAGITLPYPSTRHDFQTQELGEVDPAWMGLAYRNTENTLIIYHANEQERVGPCEDEGGGAAATAMPLVAGVDRYTVMLDSLQGLLTIHSEYAKERENIQTKVTVGGQIIYDHWLQSPGGTIKINDSGSVNVDLTTFNDVGQELTNTFASYSNGG